MIAIAGTIRNTVKLAQLDNKWKEKKSKGAKAIEKEMSPEVRMKMQYEEDLKKMRENNQAAGIDAKVRTGSTLTSEEISYLKKNNPQMYQYYLEIKHAEESYEQELESCKTKEDVERLRVTRLGNFAAEAKSIVNNPRIPEGAKVGLIGKILGKTLAIQEAHAEFTESLRYINMPTERELAEEREAEDTVGEMQEEIQEEIQEENGDSFEEISEDKQENVGPEIIEEGETDNVKSEMPKESKTGAAEKNDRDSSYVTELRQRGDQIFHEIKGVEKSFQKKKQQRVT